MLKRDRKGPSVSEKLESARANRYKVIHERNLLILAIIGHAGWEAHTVPPAGPETGTWTRVLCIHSPAGQLHWKLSEDDQKDFASLSYDKKPPLDHYDGCKASEKLARLEQLAKGLK